MASTHQIGDWTFDPAAGDLRRGEDRRRLEDRAARTLALLCRRRGEVVSQDEIVGEVWNNRQLSPNSVAVVIADLRRALGDSARQPRYIETVAKRGYRIMPEADAAAHGALRNLPPRRLLAAAFAAAALAAAGALWLGTRSPVPPPATVVVSEVVNATGDPAYAPMATAVSELVLIDLDGARLKVIRSAGETGPHGPPVRLSGKLILWTGQPTVMFSAERDGAVVWSGMAKGPEPAFPATVRAAMTELGATVAPPR